MDNIAHTLAGLTLARAGRSKRIPLVTVALVSGANLPDIDLFWSMGDQLRYLREHRGFTHSLAGTLLLVLLLWAFLLLLDRRPWRRPPAPRALPFALLGACAAGVGSHFLMDAMNSYGVRPFLPWNGRWVYGDTWVIVDPWVWLILGAAVALTGRRRRWRAAFWAAGAIATLAVMIAVPGVPRTACVLWVAAASGAALAWRRPPAMTGTVPTARRAVALVVLYGLLCAAGGRAAGLRLRRGQASPAGAIVAALPRPADPFHWDGIVATPTTIRTRIIGALPFLDPADPEAREYRRALDDPAVAAALRTCAGDAIRIFFRFPMASVEKDGTGRVVVVRDARYARQGRSGFAIAAIPLVADGFPDADFGCP